MPCRYCSLPMFAAWPHPYCSRLCADRHRWFGGVPDDVRRMAARRARPALRPQPQPEQASA